MQNLKVSIHSIGVVLVQIAIFLLLEQIYIRIIAVDYDYVGFKYNYDLYRNVAGKSIFLFVLFVISVGSRSEFLFSVLNILVTIFLIPNIIVYQYMDVNFLIVFGIALIPVLAILFSKVSVTGIHVPTIRENQKVWLLVVVGSLLLVPFLFNYGFNFSMDIFLMKDLYAFRKDSLASGNKLTNYTYSLLSSWVFPLCIVFGYLKHRRWLMLFGAAGLLYLFSVTGNKITFFVLLVTIAFLFFPSYRQKIKAMYLSVFFLFSIGLIVFQVFPQIVDLLVRRFLFLPALLNYQYFEFFDGKPVYYSHSFLSAFIDYPYQFPPAVMIGLKYYEEGTNATNGIISDGFLNLGAVGVLVNCTLAAAILAFFNKCNINAQFLGLFFLLTQLFIDSALLTLLVTHGLLIFMILTLLVIRNAHEI